MNHGQIVSFIWGVADLIRDTFKRGKYQDVILPLTVLRRLDCVLAPAKPKVLEVKARLAGRIDNLDPQLRRASGFAFYNTSRYDFEKLLADAPHIAQNLRNYIAGFSPNMREVLEKFDFDNTISKLDESGLLFQVVQRFGDPQVNLHPDAVDNAAMGTIFEELIRKFNEALNENPGEHFTPRDVVHLMVDLLLAGDEERLRKKGVVLSVYDPCCGPGGMLTIAKEHLTAGETYRAYWRLLKKIEDDPRYDKRRSSSPPDSGRSDPWPWAGRVRLPRGARTADPERHHGAVGTLGSLGLGRVDLERPPDAVAGDVLEGRRRDESDTRPAATARAA